MHNLSDRDIAYDLLYGCKSSASLYCQAVLESASPRCREVFHHIHDDGLRSQWKIWRLLHNRNEYRTAPADRREVDGVRQRMEHLAHTHQEAVRPQFAGMGGHDVDGARWNEGPRWDERGNREFHDNQWNESGPSPYGASTRAPAYSGTAGYPAGGYNTSGGYGSGVSGGYNSAGVTQGASLAGAYGGSTGGVNFEAGRNMPEGTRFEPERGFADGYDGGRRATVSSGSWGENGYGAGDRGRYGSGTAGTRGTTGTVGRYEAQGSSWNERPERDAPAGSPTRGMDGGRRSQASSQRY